MAKDSSVAPRERVNIVYKSATGDAQGEKELPLKMLVVGDFSQKKDDRAVEERKPIDVNKDNFNDVMKSHGLELTTAVPNQLEEGKKDAGEMPVKLKFKSLKDFEPEQVANQVPELKALLDLRQALAALKGPLGNLPDFRKRIQALMTDAAAREKLLKELGGEKKA